MTEILLRTKDMSHGDHYTPVVREQDKSASVMLDLRHEEDMDAAREDRVSVQEVAGRDPWGLGGEELLPGR